MCGIRVCADARVERTRGRCVLPDTCLTLFNLVNVFQFISSKLALACTVQPNYQSSFRAVSSIMILLLGVILAVISIIGCIILRRKRLNTIKRRESLARVLEVARVFYHQPELCINQITSFRKILMKKNEPCKQSLILKNLFYLSKYLFIRIIFSRM